MASELQIVKDVKKNLSALDQLEKEGKIDSAKKTQVVQSILSLFRNDEIIKQMELRKKIKK